MKNIKNPRFWIALPIVLAVLVPACFLLALAFVAALIATTFESLHVLAFAGVRKVKDLINFLTKWKDAE